MDHHSLSTQPHLFTTTALFDRVKAEVRASREQLAASVPRVLDVCAGAGALSQYLREELKLDVSATDIDLTKWQYPPVTPVEADLGRRLPFEPDSFDLVICQEGLKHVTDLSTAITELARVLKPGGRLVLTIPNDLCLQARLRYFFSGFVDIDWHGPLDPRAPEASRFLYVSSLISLPYLYYFLDRNGLVWERSSTSRLRPASLVLMVLFFPFLWRGVSRACPAGHPLRSLLLDPVWLAGRHNVIVCRKSVVDRLSN